MHLPLAFWSSSPVIEIGGMMDVGPPWHWRILRLWSLKWDWIRTNIWPSGKVIWQLDTIRQSEMLGYVGLLGIPRIHSPCGVSSPRPAVIANSSAIPIPRPTPWAWWSPRKWDEIDSLLNGLNAMPIVSQQFYHDYRIWSLPTCLYCSQCPGDKQGEEPNRLKVTLW